MRRVVGAAAAVVLVAVLAGCAALLPDTHEKAIPEKIAEAEIGASDVRVGTSWEGFDKTISVYLSFQTDEITSDQVIDSLAAVSAGLGMNSGAGLSIAFFADGAEPVCGVEETLQSLNRQLGRSGTDAVNGEDAMIFLSSGKELQEFVSELRDAGLV
ncbi:hypothetical protein ACFSWE_15405 [Leucobacter albus]|uniref:Uncharacterized protein n=1 Tax=Leucobacter albus TaxID=272210 RepID=A0ABW3TSV7_9MICO